jgi:limonene-1,2-epoxide hydrolase
LVDEMLKPKELQEEHRASSTDVVLKFIECINAGDPERLMSLQTEDFTFIDYSGDAYHGRQGWQDYFSAYPEYTIHVEHIITSGDGVAILGRTTGSHVSPEVEEIWTILWTAEIWGDLVAEWRIYSDVHEVRKKDQASRQQEK